MMLNFFTISEVMHGLDESFFIFIHSAGRTYSRISISKLSFSDIFSQSHLSIYFSMISGVMLLFLDMLCQFNLFWYFSSSFICVPLETSLTASLKSYAYDNAIHAILVPSAIVLPRMYAFADLRIR